MRSKIAIVFYVNNINISFHKSVTRPDTLTRRTKSKYIRPVAEIQWNSAIYHCHSGKTAHLCQKLRTGREKLISNFIYLYGKAYICK